MRLQAVVGSACLVRAVMLPMQRLQVVGGLGQLEAIQPEPAATVALPLSVKLGAEPFLVETARMYSEGTAEPAQAAPASLFKVVAVLLAVPA